MICQTFPPTQCLPRTSSNHSQNAIPSSVIKLYLHYPSPPPTHLLTQQSTPSISLSLLTLPNSNIIHHKTRFLTFLYVAPDHTTTKKKGKLFRNSGNTAREGFELSLLCCLLSLQLDGVSAKSSSKSSAASHQHTHTNAWPRMLLLLTNTALGVRKFSRSFPPQIVESLILWFGLIEEL